MKFIDKFDPDLYPIVEGHELVELIFSNDTSSPLVDDFEKWVVRAIDNREFKAQQVTYDTFLSLKNFHFYIGSIFGWIDSKKILQKLQQKGIKIDPRLRKWVMDYKEIGKTNIKTKSAQDPSQKKKNSPKPTTIPAKQKALKEEITRIGVPIFQKGAELTLTEFLERQSIRDAIEKSGLTETNLKPSTLKIYARAARKEAGVIRPAGPGEKAKLTLPQHFPSPETLSLL